MTRQTRAVTVATVTVLMWSGVLALCLVPLGVHAGADVVSVWITTADQSKLLQQQSPVTFTLDSGYYPTTIAVTTTQTYQAMDGFGASLTDSSAWLISTTLSASTRAALLTALFDPVNGIGLNLLRQPMGSSDFALSNYSYDDMPAGQSDPTLAHFSIQHDLAYIIPLLQQARQLNPALKIMATPWSPPGWMKTSDALVGGTLNPNAYGPLANYFVRFIEAYTTQGLPIYAVTPQNEPGFMPSGSSGMTLTATQEITLVKAMGPAFASAGLTTKILTLDNTWLDAGYGLRVLQDAAARSYIAGTAFHCYSGTPDAQSVVRAAYPSKDIYETECSHGVLTPTPFAAALAFDMHTLLIGATRNWSKTVVKWNIALRPDGGPSTWCTGSYDCFGLVTIRPGTGQVRFNEDYYALGHISKFVQPGAYRVASNTFGQGDVEDVAFRNPSGSIALIVFNGRAGPATFKVHWAGQAFVYTLPAGAAATFTWSSTPV